MLLGDKHLREAEALQGLTLEREVADLDLIPLLPYLTNEIRNWLVHSAPCKPNHLGTGPEPGVLAMLTVLGRMIARNIYLSVSS